MLINFYPLTLGNFCKFGRWQYAAKGSLDLFFILYVY